MTQHEVPFHRKESFSFQMNFTQDQIISKYLELQNNLLQSRDFISQIEFIKVEDSIFISSYQPLKTQAEVSINNQSSISSRGSPSNLAIFRQENIMKQQNCQRFQVSAEIVGIKRQDNLRNYHRGHIDYLNKLKLPIFLQSRKYCKTKRKIRGQTYFSIVGKFMSNSSSRYCKRFDQQLQIQFEKMSVREQIRKDASISSLEYLMERSDDAQNRKLLDRHEKNYAKGRKWAVFLGKFVRGNSQVYKSNGL